MQRDFSTIPLCNTLRDINDVTPPTSQFSMSSTLDDEPMIIDNELAPQPGQSDHLQSLYNHNHITNIPLMRSILRPSNNNDEKFSIERHGQIYNETLINDNNLISEAAGYDSARLAEVDADEAFALQLQQEEYGRESVIPNRHEYLPFRLFEDHESPGVTLHPSFDSNDPQVMNDEQYAAFVQQQQGRPNPRYRRQPSPNVFLRQQSNPESNRTSDIDPSNIQQIPSFLGISRRQVANSDDDSDDNNPFMNTPHPFIQFLTNHGRPMPANFIPTFSGYRPRGHRRGGNLQETEEDFGPEDYERLLRLDDTIRKKKLTKEQINSIKEEKFIPKANNTEEENKCGVCLELFENNQSLRRFPCSHIYHKECGDRWLQENNVCPICREPPIKVPSSTNSRHIRNMNHTRRGPNNNRTFNHRNHNNNNNNNNNNDNNNNSSNHSNNRRGPAPQRQS
ncbi:unnamed protein product [Rotaria socialis]